MNRRYRVQAMAGLSVSPLLTARIMAEETPVAVNVETSHLSEGAWRRRLIPAQFPILREQSTEPPWSSPLLKKHRESSDVCTACDHPFFSSETRYDSATG